MPEIGISNWFTVRNPLFNCSIYTVGSPLWLGDVWPAETDHGTTGCCSRSAVLDYGASRKGRSVGRSQESRLRVTCELQELLECCSDTPAVSVSDARSRVLSGRLYLRGGKAAQEKRSLANALEGAILF